MKGQTTSRLQTQTVAHKEAEEAVRKAYAQVEHLLSSIPSILIGVSQTGLVTHWSTVAERTFGLSRDYVLKQPISECGIPWDLEKVLQGIRDCWAKGSPIRLDDVPFKRPNGQKGFLGFTLIPLRPDTEGTVECLLFGADITERKRMDELKNAFIATVSHELRTPLTIIKEGVLQVLDGILGATNEEQRQTLSMSLEAINRLGRILNDLLDLSKIEADRFELKKELVDIVNVVQGVTAAFQARAKEKGLRLTTHLPKERLEISADKDRVIQVCTNLVANALKFTKKGEVKISVLDRGDSVECSVADTGRGIAQKDLPYVFTKFQQFHEYVSPEERGTGLGLAICKGIVESHQGRIWVESKLGEGSKFSFILPKYTAKELFREHVRKRLKEALKRESTFSIIVFELADFERLKEKWGEEKIASWVQELEASVQGHLRRKADLAIRGTRSILVLLPATKKEEAWRVVERIQKTFDDYFVKQKLETQIDLTCHVAAFPEDGKAEEELLTKVGGE